MMKRYSLRKIITAATVLLLAFAVTSCAALSPLSSAEASLRLAELLPQAELLDKVFWGVGLMPEDGYNDGDNGDNDDTERKMTVNFVPVSKDAEFQSIKQIKDAAEAVYTPDYLRAVYEMAFDGAGEQFPRYNEDENGRLLVNTAFNGFTLSTRLDAPNAKVTSGFGERVKLSVPAILFGEPSEVKIDLVNIDGVWLIDSPTY